MGEVLKWGNNYMVVSLNIHNHLSSSSDTACEHLLAFNLELQLHHQSRSAYEQTSLSWTPAAMEASQKLKTAFTSTVTRTFWPQQAFHCRSEHINHWVRDGVVSAAGESSELIHVPSSQRNSPRWRRTTISATELLAIELVIEEWRHWMEGAQQTFIVLTDHNNLE